MRGKSLFFFLVLITFHIVNAQQISIIIKGTDKPAELFILEGETLRLIDSLKYSEEKYSVDLEGNNYGIYRLKIDESHFLNFIYDGGDVVLETCIKAITDSLKIVKSESNRLYFRLLKLNRDFKIKSELLQLILTNYPRDDEYYSFTRNTLLKLRKEYLDFVNSESQKDKGSFIARYIKSSQLPVIDMNLPPGLQLELLKKHALDKVDFNDYDLIYSDVFTNKAIEYLTYYRNPNLSKGELEKEFIKAIDTLLVKARADLLVYQHIVDYLVNGFRQFGFDLIIDYIVENYVVRDDLCLNEMLENAIAKRIEQAKKFGKGERVPELFLPDRNDNLLKLNDVQADNILLLFYSIECPHCNELLTELNDFIKTVEKDKLEIVAISLEEDNKVWQEYIERKKFDFIHVNESSGWSGKTAIDYSVYATPTMFLIDHKKRIIGRPANIRELKMMLNQVLQK